MSRALATFGTGAALMVWLAAPVEAAHEVDHRYVVLGYVRDTAGRPLGSALVRVVREGTGLAYDTRTDRDGFYVVIVHLHDEDVLEPLRVAVGRATLSIEARFNPVDPRTPRGTRADFLDSAGRERRNEFLATFERYMNR